MALPGSPTDPDVHARAFIVAALNVMDGHGDLGQAAAWFERAAQLATRPATHPLLKLIVPIRHLGAWDIDELLSILPSYVDLFAGPDPWVAATARSFHVGDGGAGQGRPG